MVVSIKTVAVVFLVTLFLGGCSNCRLQGYTMSECRRLELREESLERHRVKLEEFNAAFNGYNLGEILSAPEEEDFLKRFCLQYKDKPLPTNLDTEMRIHMGKYYVHKFCKQYYADPSLVIRRNEIKFDNSEGAMYFLLTDTKEVRDYINFPISYTDQGYRFGITN